MPSEKTIELIRRLLALAGNNPNEHEAAAAAAKASELMLRHKLSERDLAEPDEEYGVARYFEEKQGRWKRKLMAVICETNFCKSIRWPNKWWDNRGVNFGIIGKPGDIQVVIYLYEYLRGTVDRLAKENGQGKGLAWSTSYKEGLVAGIGSTLRKSWNATATATAESKALVLVESTALAEATKLLFPDLSSGAGLPTGHLQRSPQLQGYLDGQKVAINRGVQGGAGRVQGLLQ